MEHISYIDTDTHPTIHISRCDCRISRAVPNHVCVNQIWRGRKYQDPAVVDPCLADHGPIRWVAVGSLGKRVLEGHHKVTSFAVRCHDAIYHIVFYYIVHVDWDYWWFCRRRKYDLGGSGLHSYIDGPFRGFF